MKQQKTGYLSPLSAAMLSCIYTSSLPELQMQTLPSPRDGGGTYGTDKAGRVKLVESETKRKPEEECQ